jgi:hypothetical protein
VTPGRTGAVAEKLVVTGHTDGDGQLLSTFDQGACAPTVTAGHTYSLRAWYQSTVPTQVNVYLRNTAGLWSYYTSSAYFAAASTWTQAEWTTPALPAGTTGLSFGLNVFQNGEITTDDYALYDTVGAPAVPGTLVAGTPTITGTAKVGETLTASPGAWTPASTTFTYQWLRGATDIAGATAATYTATAADRGAQLSVRVTGSAPDWTPPTATATSAATTAVLAGNVTTNRLAGADRFGTAIAVAQTFAPGVARLYIANGYGFPDALSAAPAAAHFSSPLLLTAPEALPAAVKAEIKRLKPTKIVIAGGVNAVSNSVLGGRPLRHLSGHRLRRLRHQRADGLRGHGLRLPGRTHGIGRRGESPGARRARPRNERDPRRGDARGAEDAQDDRGEDRGRPQRRQRRHRERLEGGLRAHSGEAPLGC